MPPASGRFPFGAVVPVAAGATVFAFACGSSSIHAVRQAGHPLRWVALVVLLGLAAAWARERRDALLLPRSVVLAATALVTVALVSALWSVEPRLSGERAVTLGILFAAALLIAQACAGRPRDAARVLLGVLGGATAVAVAGLVVLVVSHGSAVEPATIDIAERYKGIGENPDTASLLYAVTLPVALRLVLDRSRRAIGLAIAVLLFGSIVASGSRGGLLAAGIGALVLVVAWGGRARRTLVGVAVVVAVVAVGAFVETVPKPNPNVKSPVVAVTPSKPSHWVDVQGVYPLDADVGRPLPGGGEPWKPRAFFGASGRSVAWTGALEQAWGRPLVGYGFGTEGVVFVDRYFAFVGGLTENSYIGLVLELGVVGLALLLALVASLVVTGWPGLRGPDRTLTAACLGALAAGLAIALTQSYFYSVGNIATGALWITAFLLPAVAVRRV